MTKLGTTYYNLGNIKDKLHIDDTDQDSQISRLGEGADAYINTQVGLVKISKITLKPSMASRTLTGSLLPLSVKRVQV